jgi:hypothetical protein
MVHWDPTQTSEAVAEMGMRRVKDIKASRPMVNFFMREK